MNILVLSVNRVFHPPNHVFMRNLLFFSSFRLPDSVPVLKPAEKSSSSAALKIKTISKAMKAYLERAKKHDDFLALKNVEYEVGKLHLANMMGLDASTLNQDDIDRAISYLLPSGLYEKKARPMMKPPSQMFPKEKAAQFDNSGRPYSSFFYTRHANYYESLHVFAGKFLELDSFQNLMLEKGILQPPNSSLLNLSGGEWLNIDEMRKLFLENISEEEYSFLVSTLTRLATHPYAYKCKELIWKYRKDFVDVTSKEVVPPLMQDELGCLFIKMVGYKKHCTASVIVRDSGTGNISINGSDIFYFSSLQDREQVMYPISFCDLLEKVDVEANVFGPGTSAQAVAIRHALALCLRSFVSADTLEKMRLAGLLTHDRRIRGRKKPGQKGNRAKFTWKKR